MRNVLLSGVAACLLMPAGADGQERRRGVPNGHLPPPGECRVWQRGLPPGQQPPPTDCRSARREARFYGGRVVRGGREGRDEYRRYRDRDDHYYRGDRGHYYGERRNFRCDENDWRKGEC